jgi:cytochrome c-type protein NapB
MKKVLAVLFAGGIAASTGLLHAGGNEMRDDQMGLSKTSVFDDPAPDAFAYSDKDPSGSGVLPRAYTGAPPQVPHKIEAFLPIKAGKNMCVVCHDKPGMMGKKIKGIATAMPESHYNKVEDRLERSNARAPNAMFPRPASAIWSAIPSRRSDPRSVTSINPGNGSLVGLIEINHAPVMRPGFAAANRRAIQPHNGLDFAAG